ncbi:josephin-2 [Neolamprologus brichardi]|uniref:josephin-2 n=1 Tax=Neolamprologus brichardi TaxID=32507 RepID=UPI001643DEC3|nr:josephin-2 [Neolamprologus brichardi]
MEQLQDEISTALWTLGKPELTKLPEGLVIQEGLVTIMEGRSVYIPVAIANTNKRDVNLIPHTVLGHLEEIKAVYPITPEKTQDSVEQISSQPPIQLAAVWWDKRREVENLCMSKVQGFILNVPSRVSLGIVSLPLRRRHWLAVRQVSGQYYNLDSKLKSPVCIGGEAELCTFLTEQLSQDVAEMLLVVRREVEEDGSWLNADSKK